MRIRVIFIFMVGLGGRNRRKLLEKARFRGKIWECSRRELDLESTCEKAPREFDFKARNEGKRSISTQI